MYEILGMPVPVDLHSPIQGDSSPLAITYPEAMVTPTIDGRVTHFYEWASSGTFDCRRIGGAMHRVSTIVSMIYFAYDHDNVYIRLDLGEVEDIQSDKKTAIEIRFVADSEQRFAFEPNELRRQPLQNETVSAALDEVMELAVKRDALWNKGFGRAKLAVRVLGGKTELERWPVKEELTIDVPERETEIFWPP